jgi:CubicO group peptidase (beta-lactamase class C family)
VIRKQPINAPARLSAIGVAVSSTLLAQLGRALLLLGLCVTESACTKKQAPPGAAARQALHAAFERGQLAGAVGLIAQGTDAVMVEAVGWADREQRRPMTADTLFRIASMTKPVTSVAVLMLSEQGRLSLDDPLSHFIVAFGAQRVLARERSTQTVPTKRPVTLRHLLTHTSGLGYLMQAAEPLAALYEKAGITDGLTQTPLTARQNADRIASTPLLNQPGEAFHYGLSTDVLGSVIELVSGKPLDEFLQTQIFEPLGMTRTYFVVPPSLHGEVAQVYRWSDSDGLQRLPNTPIVEGHRQYSPGACLSQSQPYLSGGAGLVSTARDYLRFALMLQQGGSLDGVRILSARSVAAMTHNQIGSLELPGAEKFGFGVSIVTSATDPRPIGSFGWQGFYNTRFWVDRANERVGIFLSQLRSEAELDASGEFMNAVYQ